MGMKNLTPGLIREILAEVWADASNCQVRLNAWEIKKQGRNWRNGKRANTLELHFLYQIL